MINNKRKASCLNRSKLSLSFKARGKRKMEPSSSTEVECVKTDCKEFSSPEDLLSLNNSILGTVPLFGVEKENQYDDILKRKELNDQEQSISTSACEVVDMKPSKDLQHLIISPIPNEKRDYRSIPVHSNLPCSPNGTVCYQNIHSPITSSSFNEEFNCSSSVLNYIEKNAIVLESDPRFQTDGQNASFLNSTISGLIEESNQVGGGNDLSSKKSLYFPKTSEDRLFNPSNMAMLQLSQLKNSSNDEGNIAAVMSVNSLNIRTSDTCKLSSLGVSLVDWDESLRSNELDAKQQLRQNDNGLMNISMEQKVQNEDDQDNQLWERSVYVPKTPEYRPCNSSKRSVPQISPLNNCNSSKKYNASVQSTTSLVKRNPEVSSLGMSGIDWDETLQENDEGDAKRDINQLSGQNDNNLDCTRIEEQDENEDGEDDQPWENSVYVPKTPEDRIHHRNKTSEQYKIQPNDSSIDKADSSAVAQLTNLHKRNTELLNVTSLGVSLIDWDETLIEIGTKSPKSIPFLEKFQQQLLENGKKLNTPKNVNASKGPAIMQSLNEGPFFGLPSKVKEMISKLRGINDLYDWQKKCLSMPELQARQNLVYALPTSGGKTLVAEILLLKEVLMNKKNVIFILPYVSIVQEKVRALSQLAVELDFFVEEYAAGKGTYPPRKRRCKNSVFIATIEKALGLVHSLLQEERLHEVGLVIVDELHLLGEGSRGATLEAVLTKLLFQQEKIQIVGMSATIGNLHEIAAFLNAKTFTEDFRPVELFEYVKCGDSIYSLDRQLLGLDSSPIVLDRVLQSDYTPQQLQNDPDQIGTLVNEVVPDDSCLVFCPSRKNCENVALLICRTLKSTMKEVRVEEKKALYRALITEGNGFVCPILKQTLPFGVAYHHSGLTTAERRLLEEAYLAKTICVICCTSTLAAGVNLPARRVILRSPYIGADFIDLSRYKQMVGRAGRAGFGGFGESIMICLLKDIKKVIELLSSSMNESFSCLAADGGAGMKALVMSSVGLGMATCRANLYKLVEHSLLWVQAERLGTPIKKLVDKSVDDLLEEGAFTLVDSEEYSGPPRDINVIHIAAQPSNVKELSDLHTQLGLSRIGKAAVRGSITMVIAKRLYNDLRLAQSSLVLLNYLHLLYVVTPYQMTEQIRSASEVYFNVYMQLSKEELKVANTLGITEAVMMAVTQGRASKTVSQDILDRFYLTLMLHELWHQKPVWDVSTKYLVTRGQVYSLLTAASSFASSVLRFCEVLDEFWCFQTLLVTLTQRLSHCCSVELLPLMELPAVKIGRARQLYNAGYRTLRDVAAAEPGQLIRDVDHMPRKTAFQIIAAAKLLLIEKAEALRDEAADYLEGLAVNIRTV